METFTSVFILLFAVFVMEAPKFGCSRMDSSISCIESEKKALLRIKESLIDESDRLSSWMGEDCCTWKGVGCSNKTGHVVRLNLHNPTDFNYDRFYNENSDYAANYSRTCLGGEISPSLLDLKQLRYLDLSLNNFSGIPIPEFLGSLKNLAYLNLSVARLGGKVPHHLGNLSSLVYLDLSDFWANRLTGDSLRWISTLSSLNYLDISGVYLGAATDWLKSLNMLSSLSILNLSGCQVGTIPPLSYVNFTSLVSLNLQWNVISSSIPLWLSNITSLQRLYLDGNGFYEIPNTLGRLTSVNTFGLSSNFFNTSMPNFLGNLSNLVYLDLSNNKFRGNVPTSITNLCSLRMLNLAGNMFGGDIPSFGGSPFGCLKNLEHLLLTFNAFRGPIPTSLGTLSYLIELDVSNNLLSGSIPSSLGQLSKLEKLDTSNNSLSGVVTELHFSKLNSLNELSMSSNSLILNMNPLWIPPFQLKTIKLASCKIGPQFPSWLQTQTQIVTLIISNASISDSIPEWFEKLNSRVHYLDLSRNNISGNIPTFVESNTPYRRLILNSNKFDGPFKPIPSDVELFDVSDNLISANIPLIQNASNMTLEVLILSNNRLSGGIPIFICEIQTLIVLDLARNQLSGSLPSCLGDLQHLYMFDLTDNNLYGDLPSSLGSLSTLMSLHLYNNRFSGTLPLTLHNMTGLRILDLGKNEFTDVIPPWIGEKLSNLAFLILQSNNFYGDIPPELCWLSELQLLNLAQNNITGNIPHCFGNFTAMVTLHDANEYSQGYIVDVNYGANVIDTIKGIALRFTTTLPFLTSIDVSNNSLGGDIPKELTNLFGLRNLDLAENHLKGRIPENIGNLRELESLDLSRNELSGAIPPSLSDLNYLSRLNLSFNNLSGPIPRGNQLQTLDDPSIYMGNSGLCGAPLLKDCASDEKSSTSHKNVDSEGGDWFEPFWFSAGIGPGFFVGFVGVCTILHFKISWRVAYFKFVENLYNKVF